MAIRAFVLGLGLGVGLMYVLDPDRGRRRRAMARDQLVHLRHEGAERGGAKLNDLRNRARGVVTGAKGRMRSPSEPVSDEVLVERVRAKLGHMVSHPAAIMVTANEGRVTLSGPILAHEAEAVISRVLAIPGVVELSSELDLHDRPDGVPGLQGQARRQAPGVF